MRTVTCICDVFINGVLFANGGEYKFDYSPLWGIMIYTTFGTANISKWEFDNYFI
jgi:hypothetical protein